MTGGARLRRLDGRQAGHCHPLLRDVTTLGTHPACDVLLAPEESRGVALRHAALLKDSSGWMVRHLEGGGGTWVNGARIRRERRLHSGDTVRLGERGPAFRFEADGMSPVAGTAARGQAGRRRTLFVLGVVGVLAVGWLAWRATQTPDRTWETLLARVDSLATELRATEARESTLAVRLGEAVAEAAETRTLLVTPGRTRPGLDSLTRRVDRLGEIQGDLFRATAFDAAAVVAANRDAVALLLVEYQDHSTVSGTAVAMHRSGDTSWVVTSRHLVVDSLERGARRIGLAFDGTAQVFEAILVGSDADHDLALLRTVIRGGTPVISGTSAGPPPGTPVAVITFPLGIDLAAPGEWRLSGVTASAYTATVTYATPQRLVLDGYGSPGMSGSPVLNGAGDVVGIVFGGATESAGRIVFAVPGEALSRLLARAGSR